MRRDLDSEENIGGRKSLAARIAEAISRLFRKKKRAANTGFSRFAHFLNGLEKGTDLYKAVQRAVVLCDESLNVVGQRMSLIGKLRDVEEKLAELDCYDRLTEEEFEQLRNLLERFSSLVRDKNTLKYQVTGFNKSVTYMSELEDEAPLMIGEIKEAEDKQRMFRQDIGYLRGEKSELEYERENITFAIDFIYKFTIGLVVFFALVMTFMVFSYVFGGADILFPASAVFVVVVVMTVLLYSLRNRLKFELQLNMKKQSRAVELINKKSAVYAHYTNFLNYEYKKFRVRNSDMLKDNLREYGHYKHLTKRFDSIRSIMYQTEEEIQKFLRAKGISTMSASVESFVQSVNIDDKKNYHAELQGDKATIERNLSSIDLRQEKIWDELTALNDGDASEEHIIGEIIKTYIDEAGRIVARFGVAEKSGGEEEPVDSVESAELLETPSVI